MTTSASAGSMYVPAAGDGLKSADERLEGRVLEHEATCAGIERLVQKRRVSEAGVNDGATLRSRPCNLANNARARQPRHPQVEHGE
jgi:hypothetical protein